MVVNNFDNETLSTERKINTIVQAIVMEKSLDTRAFWNSLYNRNNVVYVANRKKGTSILSTIPIAKKEEIYRDLIATHNIVGEQTNDRLEFDWYPRLGADGIDVESTIKNKLDIKDRFKSVISRWKGINRKWKRTPIYSKDEKKIIDDELLDIQETDWDLVDSCIVKGDTDLEWEEFNLVNYNSTIKQVYKEPDFSISGNIDRTKVFWYNTLVEELLSYFDDQAKMNIFFNAHFMKAGIGEYIAKNGMVLDDPIDFIIDNFVDFLDLGFSIDAQTINFSSLITLKSWEMYCRRFEVDANVNPISGLKKIFGGM